MGILKDAMDKRADSLLKKALDSSMANLKLAMASTLVVRNLHWLEQLKQHIEGGTSREDLLDTRMSTRTSALINSVRRALWLKT